MGKQKTKLNYRRTVLRLPDLDHSKMAVLNSLPSPSSRRVYQFAINQFIAWYCSEPRLAFNRIVVVRYRMYLESRRLAANTINQQLAAVLGAPEPGGGRDDRLEHGLEARFSRQRVEGLDAGVLRFPQQLEEHVVLRGEVEVERRAADLGLERDVFDAAVRYAVTAEDFDGCVVELLSRFFSLLVPHAPCVP